jgi:hypothetical protein
VGEHPEGGIDGDRPGCAGGEGGAAGGAGAGAHIEDPAAKERNRRPVDQ